MTSSIYRPDSRAWLDVDLGAIRRNAERLHRGAGVPLVAMVKADAYGLGATPIARALGASFRASFRAPFSASFGDDASPAGDGMLWGLGVAALDEARALRADGCTARVLLTSPTLVEEFADAQLLGVRVALHRADDIAAWRALGGGPWHLAIDTGMARGGVRWDAVAPLAEIVRACPPEGVFTHFHSADLDDGSRHAQEARFDRALDALREALPRDVLVHTDNSAAIAARVAGGVRSPGSLARPGIGLYGAAVLPALPLEQTFAFRARVIDLRDVHDGETVSYGGTWSARGTRRVATVGAGYGDGYRRALSNGTSAILHGRRVPVVGLVTMDMTMFDVTDVPCAIGDVITLVGGTDDETSATQTTDDVAAAGTLSPYELLVGLRLRVPRRYHGEKR